MDAATSLEDGTHQNEEEADAEEADPRGFHELAFLGESNAAEAEPELEERDVGAEFDCYEEQGGDKLRLLDCFSIYYEDGRPAPPKALDSAKERGETFVVFGTLVAPISNVAKAKLKSLDKRLKGNIPPCLAKDPDRGSPEPLPWVPVAAPAPAAAKGVKGPNRGKGSSVTGKKMKHPPKGTNNSTRKRSVEESTFSDIADSGDGSLPSGGAKSGQDIDEGAADRGKIKRARKSKTRMDDGGMSREGGKENTTKLGVGGTGGNALGSGSNKVEGKTPTPGASGAHKKRKANSAGKSGSTPPLKKTTLQPSFSMAAISMRLDGTEARGVPSAEFVGHCFRRGRKDGLLLYYVDRAPRDYPLEYESKIAGASSMDWSMMRKDLKVDALCMETFKWYGAKVAEVSLERRQVKVHFNGWKSRFDEWVDWESFRLAPCGSRSSAKRDGVEATGLVKKESTTRCIIVSARRTVRIRISRVDDWCIDYSDPQSPILWIISPNAWYKVAGSGWWDFVEPHRLYAPFFEPSRTAFVVTSLVARCLKASPWSSFAAIGRRVTQISSGRFDVRDIIEDHEVVIPSVVGMGTLKKSKKTGKADDSGEDAEEDGEGTLTTSNGDSSFRSVEGKDTLFLKELRVKAEEWEANGRSFERRVQLAPPPVPTLPARGTTKALTDGRLFADSSSGGSGSGGCSKPNDDSRSSGDSRSGGGMDVTPNGPLESPRPMGGDPKIGGGASRTGGKGRKSIGGGSKAGPKAPKGGYGGNTDGEVPKPGGRGFKPGGGGFKPGGEGPKPSGEGRKPSGEGRKPSGEGHKPSRESPKPSGEGPKSSGDGPKSSGGGSKPGGGGSKHGGGGSKPSRGGSKPRGRSSMPVGRDLEPGDEGPKPFSEGPKCGGGGPKPGGGSPKPGGGGPITSSIDGESIEGARMASNSTVDPKAARRGSKGGDQSQKASGGRPKAPAGGPKAAARKPKAVDGGHKVSGSDASKGRGRGSTPRSGIRNASSRIAEPTTDVPKPSDEFPRPNGGPSKPSTTVPKAGSLGQNATGGVSRDGSVEWKAVGGEPKPQGRGTKAGAEGSKSRSRGSKSSKKASKANAGDLKIDDDRLKVGSKDLKASGGRLKADCTFPKTGDAGPMNGGVRPKANSGGVPREGGRGSKAGSGNSKAGFGSSPSGFGSPSTAFGGSSSSGFGDPTTDGSSCLDADISMSSLASLRASNSGTLEADDADEADNADVKSAKVRGELTPRQRLEMKINEQRMKAEKAERLQKEKADKLAAAAQERLDKEERQKREREVERARKMKERQDKIVKQQEEKAKLLAKKEAERQASLTRKIERQRLLAEEKERIRTEKERERKARVEQKRLEKEAKDKERAEQHAKEQARRESEREKIRLAKRYPLPDEELWQEEQQLGIQPRPWPAPGTLPIPPGFPARAFEDAVSAWSCLQLFGTLMHLRRFSLNELMVALVEGTESSTINSNGASSSSWGHQVQAPPSQLPQGPAPPLADPASLLDIIPAPLTFDAVAAGGMDSGVGVLSAAPPGGVGGPTPKPGASMLANIHIRLLDFLAWDRARTLTCGREGKQDAYWGSLLPSLGGGGDSSGHGDVGSGHGASGDDDEFGGAPETTLAGLRGSRELIQASPHGFPELLRLVAIHSQGVFRRVEPRRTAAAQGFAGLATGRDGNEDERSSIPMQAIALDPLGEVIRILRHVMRSEESRPFLGTPTDADVNPEGMVTDHQPRRPLDLGTILKRAESGWYDMDPGSQPPVTSNSFGAGHAGVAQDVELVQEGWLEARGRDSVIYEQARALVDDFMALYEAHVLKPLGHLERSDREGRCPATKDVNDGDGNREGFASSLSPPKLDSKLESMEMVRRMGCEEYARWSPAVKSRALAMLCDEAMSSGTLSDVARKVFEARETVDRKDREMKASVRDMIRGQQARESQGLQTPTSTSRRGTEAEMMAARLAAEGPEFRTLRQLGHLRVRLKPLGTDRYRRRYWLLAQGEDHRVFTQLDDEWGCYERVSQLKALHTWLDRRGTRERVLKAAIREHLTINLGVSPDDLYPPSRPSGLRGRGDWNTGEGSKCYEEDRQEYIGEPAEVAREKERERTAGKEALKSCGFFPEEQRNVLQRQCSAFAVDRHSLRAAGLAFEPETSAVVMRDLVIYMGPHGLGLLLNVQRGGVVVSELTQLPPGVVNPGQAAGVQVGDLVVSVDNIVAEKPRSLAEGLNNEHLAKSGKKAIMKVLTRVPLTDGRGEPLASAMKYSAVDMVKGALLEGEIMLHHSFVIGAGWKGQACREWRLGVSFAGQGVGRGLEHGTLTAAGATSTNSSGRTGQTDGSEAAAFPTGHHPPLQGVGAIELGPITEEAVKDAVKQLGRRMLQLEALVSKQDTVVDARWGKKGRRRKWRTFVHNAQTAAQLLAAWGAFRKMIDWEAASGCFSKLDRRTFLALLPGNARNEIPDKGNSVIYFGDGHALSVEAEAKAGYRAAWGVDAPKPGAIGQFTVKSIGYYQGGSHRRAKGAQPFVTMELEPLPTPNAFPELGLLPPSEPFGTLNRLLKRSIKAMRGTPDVVHFLEPVSRTIYPDYYDVISEPMDLSKLWKRCSTCRYKTVEQFKHDLSLVASNCRLYCQDKFPNLPPAADAAVKVGMATLDEPTLAAALTKTVEEGSRLENVWNTHMLAAISAAPELATMPGMRKLARQFGFSTGGDQEAGGDTRESESDDDDGQPDAASIARQVFYDKLVGIKYATSEAGRPSITRSRKHEERNPTKPRPKPEYGARAGFPEQVTHSIATTCASSSSSSAVLPEHQPLGLVAKVDPPSSSTETTPMDVEPEVITPPNTMTLPSTDRVAIADIIDMETDAAGTIPSSSVTVKSEDPDRWVAVGTGSDNALAMTPLAAGSANGVGKMVNKGVHVEPDSGARLEARTGGTLRVSMRLSNEMPEFVIMTSKYEEAVGFEWRSEMRIQMSSSEEAGESSRVCEGMLVGVKPKDKDTGIMPWESLQIEWDDEADVNTVNPWEVEAVSAAMVAARHRPPGG